MFEKSRMRHWAIRVAAGGAALVSSAVALPGMAHADTPGCPGQMICLYSGEQLVATYRDQTSDWQYFNGAHRLTYAENGFNPYSTRTARVVYFLNRDGTTGCIEPGRYADLTEDGDKAVQALQIRPGGKCYPGQ